MAVTNLVYHPDETLRTECDEVEDFEEVDDLVGDLTDTLQHHQGLGLAAPQIGSTKRVFVINEQVLEEGTGFDPKVFVNPEIVEEKGEEKFSEGCLSMPGVEADVPRSLYVTVQAYDEDGEEFEYEGSGYHASVLQHELDHLDGVMFIDRIGRLRRRMITKKYKKIYQQNDLGENAS